MLLLFPVLLLALLSDPLIAALELGFDAALLFFAFTPLDAGGPPARRSSLLLAFDKDDPGRDTLDDVGALLSDFARSVPCGLLVAGNLGAEPVLLLAFLILGGLFVMHLQLN